jgi:hypothetical protein
LGRRKTIQERKELITPFKSIGQAKSSDHSAQKLEVSAFGSLREKFEYQESY